MYAIKKITKDLVWVGANDRRLSYFEGVYSVPKGVSYNSYLLNDDVTVLFDTVDKAVGKTFFVNVTHALSGRRLDYVVVHHMEPDHSATLKELILMYPDVKVICNEKTRGMFSNFFNYEANFHIVNEGDTLNTGKHNLTFINAPMVHWPEVMMTYDATDKILFSADAFGSFGALNGAIFADRVDFDTEYMEEARRYYTNIVGKYGNQVQAVLKKASGLDVSYICPLHGFVWRKNIGDFIDKYVKWSTYTPEETGVVIAYASVYGNTENVAEIIACRLEEQGIKTVLFDLSVVPASEVISACFKYSHFVFASTTYNAGIFVRMEEFLHDLAAHNIQNRTVALVENGSWAPTSGKLMREILEKCKNITILDNIVTVKSSLRESQLEEIDALVQGICNTIPKKEASFETTLKEIDTTALFKLSYGLFVLTAREGEKDNGCIINTAMQISEKPERLSISVNNANLTCEMIKRTGMFNVSVLTNDVPFSTFEKFGFVSGRDKDKFENYPHCDRSENGIYYITKNTNAFFSVKVTKIEEYESHTVFTGEIIQAKVLSDEPSVTYSYYFDHIKPKQGIKESNGKVWICKICGYIYDEEKEGVAFDALPDDWVCPLCKHPKSDFELQ